MTSPALTMVPKTPRVVAYAFALVTIIVSGIVAVNVGAKVRSPCPLASAHR